MFRKAALDPDQVLERSGKGWIALVLCLPPSLAPGSRSIRPPPSYPRAAAVPRGPW
jgi:hypothetical protein